MVLVTGTIRKAQNLLKQYSQQCLDGKKGASNLIPIEGNHSFLFFSLFDSNLGFGFLYARLLLAFSLH